MTFANVITYDQMVELQYALTLADVAAVWLTDRRRVTRHDSVL